MAKLKKKSLVDSMRCLLSNNTRLREKKLDTVVYLEFRNLNTKMDLVKSEVEKNKNKRNQQTNEPPPTTRTTRLQES